MNTALFVDPQNNTGTDPIRSFCDLEFNTFCTYIPNLSGTQPKVGNRSTPSRLELRIGRLESRPKKSIASGANGIQVQVGVEPTKPSA